MKVEPNRRYRVISKSGKVFEGFVTVEFFGNMVAYVYSDCYRLISAQAGPHNYGANPPTGTFVTPRFLIATVSDPDVVEPLDMVPKDQLPYGAVEDGDWYRSIRVPYTPLPANSYASR